MTDAHRNAARAMLLTPDNEILLQRILLPHLSFAFWLTPGGGLERGESAEQGLRRELREELGLSAFDMGPLL